MSTHKKFIIALSLIISNIAFAHYYPGRFSLAVSQGYGTLNTGNTPNIMILEHSFSHHVNHLAWGASANYFFGSHSRFQLGLETGYFKPGDSSYTLVIPSISNRSILTFSQYGIDLLAVGRVHLTKHFNAIAKFGATFVEQTQHLSIAEDDSEISSFETSHSKIRPTAALGIQYQYDKHFALGITGRYTFGPNDFIKSIANIIIQKEVASNGAILADLTYTFA